MISQTADQKDTKDQVIAHYHQHPFHHLHGNMVDFGL